MNIRSTAGQWYQMNYGRKPKYFRSSKYFQAFESWSRTPVWWFNLPLQWLEDKAESYVTFLGEKTPDGNEFNVLKIPIDYVIKHLNGFDILAGKSINLMLSAETHNKYKDVRGEGMTEFSQFITNHK